MINKHSFFLSFIWHQYTPNPAPRVFTKFGDTKFCTFFLKVWPDVFAWSGRRVLAWPGTGTVWQQCVSNTSEAQSINFFHYFTIESDEWFSSFSLSELLAERRAFERRAKSEIQKLNAWALAIQGKKLSGERIANLEKMSECPALQNCIFLLPRVQYCQEGSLHQRSSLLYVTCHKIMPVHLRMIFSFNPMKSGIQMHAKKLSMKKSDGQTEFFLLL